MELTVPSRLRGICPTAAVIVCLLGAAMPLARGGDKKDVAVKAGFTPTPLASPLFAAAARTGGPAVWLLAFSSPGDVGYALLSGDLDAGLVEISRAIPLLRSPRADRIEVAGAVLFPYGATLVVRKDQSARLKDLEGRKIAARDPGCQLLKQFLEDARHHGLTIESGNLVYLPFDAMLPALEAGRVDAAILKGSQAVLAEKGGNKVVYQNWKIAVENADECCPPSLPQADSLLLVRRGGPLDTEGWAALLEETNRIPPATIRKIIAERIAFPAGALDGFPMPEFQRISRETLDRFLNHHKHE